MNWTCWTWPGAGCAGPFQAELTRLGASSGGIAWDGGVCHSQKSQVLCSQPEKAMAPHSSTLARKTPWMEEPGRLQSMGSLSRTRLSNFTFTFHFHALEKEMATHSSVLAWRIPGTGKPGGLPSMGSHRVGHDWHDLAAANMRESYSSSICNSKTNH